LGRRCFRFSPYAGGVTSEDPISEAELDAMQRRAEAAAPGPWEAFVEGPDDAGSSCILVCNGEDDIYLSPGIYANRESELDLASDPISTIPTAAH
jgi:hypothetical protein